MVKPKNEVYWFTLKKPAIQRLHENIVIDVAVIGGGIAGLAAAQAFVDKGLKVAILEKDFVGAGASGKSSGFVTPDSELELSDLVSNYGEVSGKKLWEFAKGGVEAIRQNIKENKIDCDYAVQDSLFIANSSQGFRFVLEEHETQDKFGYPNSLYTRESMQRVLGSGGYHGAIRYPDTFGINSYLYCQGMKEVLIKKGVRVFEGSEALKIEGQKITTPLGSVTAKHIVVCADSSTPKLELVKSQIYQAQTFLAISKPLTESQVRLVFPEKKMMVWDSDLIYHYYRITGDNRLLFGGSDLLFTYYPKERESSARVLKKMYAYLKQKFPKLEVEFEYFWPGLIGVSKDFAPVVGRSETNENVYFAAAGAGLPWSVAIGEYVCDKTLDDRNDLDFAFSSDRRFFIGKSVQQMISKPVAFALSHGKAKFFN